LKLGGSIRSALNPRLSRALAAAIPAAALAVLIGAGADRSEASFPPAENGKIGFVSDRDGGDDDIFVANADGSNPVNITSSSGADDFAPRFSPDGRRIAFISLREGPDRDIWVMNADGSSPINLFPNNSSGELSPHWSPDGKKLVFITDLFDPVTANDLGTINPDGTGLARLSSLPQNEVTPSYSSDGTRIIFGIGQDIWVMNADGTSPVNLTANSSLNTISAVFAPGGKQILFAAPDPGGGDDDIFRMNADGSNPVNLTQGLASSEETSPRTSPDGQRILFISDRDAPGRDVFVMNADGSNPVPLTPAASGDNRGPDWEFVYNCGGSRATIVGTDSGETLKGTKKADTIVANGGNDKVQGRGGADRICGGSGKDKLYGGAANDRLFGQAGKDLLVGGKGDDRLKGGGGKDKEKQ
jgi:Tol biopolymer transport system component